MPDINFNDAQQALGFILPQQYRIEQTVYQVRYPSFDYASLVPVNSDGDMWDLGTVFFSGDIAGQARWLAGGAFDMPYADVSRSQFLQSNHLAGIGYEWNLQELQRAAKLGRQLGNEKAMAASRVAEAFTYGIAIRGDTAKNTTGLINDANIPASNVPADGTASATGWSTKTPDLILRDVNLVLTDVINNSKETSTPTKLLLPTTSLQQIASTKLGTASDTTILEFIRKTNVVTAQTGQPLDIKGSRELETAGASSTKRMMAYESSPDVIQFHLPGPHEFLPPFQKGSMVWEVAGITNIGGVEVRLPKGASYRDGI